MMKVEERFLAGTHSSRHTHTPHTHNEARLTTALLSSGSCHLVSRHQLTGQLLLSSASTQTLGLIKPQPRHSPINHLMMSYHGDHWAPSIYTQEHISAHTGHKGSGESKHACACKDTQAPTMDTNLHRCAKVHTASIASSLSWRCEKQGKKMTTVPFDSTALILGAARISV